MPVKKGQELELNIDSLAYGGKGVSRVDDFVIFVKANNLTDEEARVHQSFLKDVAPLPARGFEFGIRGSF